MKRIITLLLILLTSIHLSAQSVNTTKNWFDGHNYYTSEKVGERLYRFKAESADNENNFSFYIEETIDGPRFREDKNNFGYIPIRAPFDSRAYTTDISGKEVISILNEDFTTVWALVRTDKSHRDCLASQLWHTDQSLEWNMKNMIFNTYYLSSISKTQLRYMQETLYSKSGKLTGIESHNLSLIVSELDVPDYKRYIITDYMAQMEDEDEGFSIVRNASEFIDAIKNGARIKVADNTSINLSEILEDHNAFVGNGRKRLSEGTTDITSIKVPTIVSEAVFDGWQLDIVSFSDIIIKGGYNSHIVVNPAYAFVLNFVNCNDITVENLTMGHTVEGYCMGGVIGAENCNPIKIYNCDLYGCGAYGFVARESSFCMDYTIIRDCSYGIMQLYGIKDGQFNCCDFFRNKEYSMVEIDGNSSTIYFDTCRFAQNQGVLFATDSKVKITSCLIRHPDPNALGSLHNVTIDDDTKIYYDNEGLTHSEAGPTKQPTNY